MMVKLINTKQRFNKLVNKQFGIIDFNIIVKSIANTK